MNEPVVIGVFAVCLNPFLFFSPFYSFLFLMVLLCSLYLTITLFNFKSFQVAFYCLNKLYCRSYRMSHIFVDVENVCEMQQIVEDIIGDAVESNTLGVIQQRRRRTRLNDRRLEKWFKYR